MAQVILINSRRPRPLRRSAAIIIAAASALLIAGFFFHLNLSSGTPIPINTTAQIAPRNVVVVDGDTVRANGHSYRLVGFDTPEVRNARCAQEQLRGDRATARLRALIMQGGLALTEVKCACQAGNCNYGRRCATLNVNGEDVGEILIREGLARAYRCSSWGCPPREGWC
jgi:endonuclease YncB( thermonuclease family)